jgi:hypothetical protein
LLVAAALFLLGCGVKAKPFANGTVQQAGPVEVALTLDPNPPRAGKETLLTFQIRRGGQPVAPEDVKCELVVDMPKMPMNLPALAVQAAGPGTMQARYAFPMAGGWTATLKVSLKDGSQGAARFAFDVGP